MKYQRFLNYFFLIILITTIGCENNSVNSDEDFLKTYADSIFKTSIDSSEIAGATILVYQKDKTLLDESYGYASLELSHPMPIDPIFEIGSVTKQFTAAAILKLVEDEKIRLEDDFTKYLEFDTGGRKITIENLLNHTSGIPSYTEIEEFWNLSIHEYPRDSLVHLVEENKFLFEPNEALIYNNSGYFFLGLIIEKVTGKSYEEFLKETFFHPLEMKYTHYSSNSKIIKNKVYGYEHSPEGLKQRSYLDHTWPYAAGSLSSSSKDLLKWMKSLHSGKILPDSLYHYLITPAKLKDGSSTRYSMGLINFSNFGHHQISHVGGINGFLSETRYYPDEDLYIICLVNTMGPKGADYFANEMTWKLLSKQDYESVDIDIDLQTLEGKYIGPVRGAALELELKPIANGLTYEHNFSEEIDTLTNYIGNNTWMDDNNIIIIKDDEYRIDVLSGYYILKKESN